VAKFAGSGHACAFCCAPTSGFAREDLMSWSRPTASIPVRTGQERAAHRRDQDPSLMWSPPRAERTPDGAPLQELHVDDAPDLERAAPDPGQAEWTQGEANPRFVVTSLGRDECKAKVPV